MDFLAFFIVIFCIGLILKYIIFRVKTKIEAETWADAEIRVRQEIDNKKIVIQKEIDNNK